MKEDRMYVFDGIKGIACFIIAFFFHHGINGFGGRALRYIASIGDWCVELFFIVSGFCMAMAYKNKICSMSASEYILRRTRKIMPLYWITAVVAFLIYQLCLTQSEQIINVAGCFDADVSTLFFAVFGMKTGWITGAGMYNGPAWFVCVLLLCYLIYYLIAKTQKYGKEHYIFLVFLWLIIGLTGSIHQYNVPFLYDCTCRGYIGFSMGLLLYEIYFIIPKTNVKLSRTIVFGNGIVLVIILTLVILLERSSVLGNERLASALIIWPCFIFMILYSNILNKIFSLGIFRFLGGISMSIFLWHWSVRSLMVYIADCTGAFTYGSYTEYIVYVVLTMVIAVISNKYLEPKLTKSFDSVLSVVLSEKNI